MSIDRLKEYKYKAARIKVLSNYYNGNGVVSKPFREDDELQRMHSKWRVEPDYLTEEDKQLVKTAREYLIGNPTGTFNQLAAVPKFGIDSIDTQRLQELRKKVKRVIADRNQSKNDIDTVLDRVSELQELKAEMKRMDLALEALASIKSAYTEVLRLRYIEGLPVNEIAQKMFINRRTAHWQMRL